MSEILSQFPDEELPVSSVDISRAMQTGRRRRRVRSVLAAGAAVAAVIVAGVATAAALLPHPADPVTPGGQACGTWERFDPLISEIDAGGISGYEVSVAFTSTYWQAVQLTSGSQAITVTLYACGGEPHSVVDETQPVDPTAGEPAQPVDGATAYWLAGDQRYPVTLAWQWTPGAWAFVSPEQEDPAAQCDRATRDRNAATACLPTTVDAAALRSLATRVADQLEFGAGTPVTAPFSLPVPDGLYPAVVLSTPSTVGGDVVGFHMGFDEIGTPAPTHIAGYVPDLWVGARTFAAVDDLPDHATPYPEDLGYPAYQSDYRDEGRADSEVLLVFDVFGFGFDIEPRGMTGPREETFDAAADIFRSITVYPGAADDVSAWGDPIAS